MLEPKRLKVSDNVEIIFNYPKDFLNGDYRLENDTIRTIANAIVFAQDKIRSKKTHSIIYIPFGKGDFDFSDCEDLNKVLAKSKIFDKNKKTNIFYLMPKETGQFDVSISNLRVQAVIYNIKNKKKVISVCRVDLQRCHIEKSFKIKSGIYKSCLEQEKYLMGNISNVLYREKLAHTMKREEGFLKELKEREKHLKQELLKGDKEYNYTSFANSLLNTSWIDCVKVEEDGVKILTKNISMNLVPLVALHINPSYVERENRLYEIIKNQLLGYNFISIPCYYSIPSDLNVRFERFSRVNETYKQAERILSSLTYFRGVSPHIGSTGKCYGEFQSAIAFANINGPEYIVPSLESYLRSANTSDPAGINILHLPMGTPDGEITCWPIVDAKLKRNNVSWRGKKTWKFYERFLNDPRLSRLNFDDDRLSKYMGGSNINNLIKNLEIIKQREPSVYEKIIKLRGEDVKAW